MRAKANHNAINNSRHISASTDSSNLNERLNLALEAATVGTWLWDLKTDRLSWDEHMKKLFLLKSDVNEASFLEFLNYVHPADRNIIKIKTQRAIKGKEQYVEFEHRLVRADGTVHVIATRGKIFHDQNGEAVQMAGASCDVTARKQAEQRLRHSEEKYRSIVETTNEWIWEIDAEGRHTYNNRALFRILGYRPSELLGLTCLPFVHEDDREYLAHDLRQHIEARTGWNNVIVRWYHKDGSLRYLESTAVPIIDEAGAVKGFRGADRDITARRQADQALAELSERLNMALRAANMGTWSWHIKDDVITWDDYMYHLFGKTPGKFSGGYDDVIGCVFQEDRAYVERVIQQAIHAKTNFEVEHRVQGADGNIRYIAVRGKIFCDEHDKATRLTGVSWDITARRKVERSKEEHQLELAQVARLNSIGEMASALAHELNQPLAAIVNYTRGCVRRLESGNFQIEQVLHAMQMAAEQSERAGEIIHRLKNGVRKSRLYYEAIDVNKIIQDMAAHIVGEARELNLNLQLELDGEVPALPADRSQIEQVMLNLMRNAVEAMRDAQTAAPNVQVRTALVNATMVTVDVIDNGPGFSGEIDQLFLRHYFSSKTKGVGMGLAICRTIIEAHGGRLSAKLNPDGGAWFQFTLPVMPIETQ